MIGGVCESYFRFEFYGENFWGTEIVENVDESNRCLGIHFAKRTRVNIAGLAEPLMSGTVRRCQKLIDEVMMALGIIRGTTTKSFGGLCELGSLCDAEEELSLRGEVLVKGCGDLLASLVKRYFLDEISIAEGANTLELAILEPRAMVAIGKHMLVVHPLASEDTIGVPFAPRAVARVAAIVRLGLWHAAGPKGPFDADGMVVGHRKKR